MARKQIRDGEWTGRWIADKTVGTRPDGKPDRIVRVVDTEEEALALERLVMHEAGLAGAEDVDDATDRMLFKDFVERVFWPMKSGLADNTKMGYERDLKNRLIPAFGNVAIGDVNAYRIQRMINGCATRKVATNAVETLSSVLSCACGLRILTYNPANYNSSRIKYTYPKASPREGSHYGEWISRFDDQYRLLKWLKDNCPGSIEERVVVLGLCFGLRPQEIPALDMERVDFDARGIWIVQASSSAGGSHLVEPKTKSKRFVPMCEWAFERMSEWRICASTSPDLNGEPAHPVVTHSAFKRCSLACCKRRIAKLRATCVYEDGSRPPRFTTESLRHSFATAAIRDGVPIQTVSRWLGHSNVTTTMNRYCKSTEDDIASDIGIVDLAFARARAAMDGAEGAGAAIGAPSRSDEDLLADARRLLLNFAVDVEGCRPTKSGELSGIVDEYAGALLTLLGARNCGRNM